MATVVAVTRWKIPFLIVLFSSNVSVIKPMVLSAHLGGRHRCPQVWRKPWCIARQRQIKRRTGSRQPEQDQSEGSGSRLHKKNPLADADRAVNPGNDHA